MGCTGMPGKPTKHCSGSYCIPRIFLTPPSSQAGLYKLAFAIAQKVMPPADYTKIFSVPDAAAALQVGFIMNS